ALQRRAPAPAAALVALRREQLLAGAGLAEQQDGRLGGRHLLNLIDDAAHRGALPDDAAQAKEAGGIAARAQVLDAAIGILRVEGGEGQSIAVRRSIRRRSPNGSLPVACFRGSP